MCVRGILVWGSLLVMPDSISALEQNEHPSGDLDTGECSSSAGEAGWKQNTGFRVPLQSGVKLNIRKILNEHIFSVLVVSIRIY